MRVQYAIGETLDNGRAQNPHEPGEYHGLRAGGLERVAHSCGKGVSIQVVGPVDDLCRHSSRRSSIERRDAVTIAQHQHRLGTKVTVEGHLIEQCLQVRSRT